MAFIAVCPGRFESGFGVGVGRPGVTCERAWRCIVVADIRPLHVAMTAVAPSRGPATPRPSPFPVISFIDLHLLT